MNRIRAPCHSKAIELSLSHKIIHKRTVTRLIFRHLVIAAVWYRMAGSRWIIEEQADVVVRAIVEAVTRWLRSTLSSTADLWW